MDLRCSIEERRGFTLVELLVSISIIAVLLGILIPALGGARESAQSLLCNTRLRGIGQCMVIRAGENGGIWPNQFEDDMQAPIGSFTSGTVKWTFSYYEQTRMWPGGLIDVIWSEGDSAEVWTCPAVVQHEYGLAGGAQHLIRQPADGGVVSYYYSPTLISRPALWREGVSALPFAQLDRYRRKVTISSVRFPSDKVAMAEIADFHGKDLLLASDPAVDSLNALFCDGSVTRQRIAETVPALPTQSMYALGSMGGDEIVPFVGTPDGINGTDLR